MEEPGAMRIMRWPGPPIDACKGAVVAIGNFDGVHSGHRGVIAAAAARARALYAPLGVVTFEPHPREVMQPEAAPTRLTSLARKAAIMRGQGVRRLYVLRFDAALMRRSAEEFIEEVLERDLGVKAIAAGRDFRFGNRRQGDVAMLQARAAVPVDVVEPVILEGAVCSSTRIREHLVAGEVDAAAKLLGYPYELEGVVGRGDQRGRTIGFPTANVRPKGRRPQLPGIGVYAVRAGVRRGGAVTWWPAVANLGRRPTVDGRTLLLEVHLLDGGADLYGLRLRVAFLARLRGERKFEGLDALRAQIARDCDEARTLHGRLAA